MFAVSVFAGAANTNQPTAAKSGNSSAMVGTSGKFGSRFGEVNARIFSLLSLTRPARPGSDSTIAGRRSDGAGEVRIGCGEAFGAGVLPAILERLGRQYPRIVYHVVLTTSPEEELRVLRERRIDLLLTRVEEPFLEDDMDADVLFHERLCVVTGENNKWARRRRIELAELLDERWILTPPNSVPFALVEEAFRAKGLAVPVARAVSFSVHLRNSLLPTGRYLTVLPLSCLRYSPMRSALRALPVDFQSRPTPVAVVTLKHRTPNPVAQIVIECAREVVQPLRETKST
jgi:DNA-binding transcriptional LysR family regulator